MKILVVTHATFFQPDRIVSGNSIRAYYLIKGLIDNGIEVAFAYPKELASGGCPTESSSSYIDIRSFGSQSELHRLVRAIKPQAILVGYWEMLDYFPENYEIPIIADLIAPRLLEALFQQDQDISLQVSRMIALYRRASRFICGTQRQRQFLIPWLILAGFDCRFEAPIDIIPISSEPRLPHHRQHLEEAWTIVTGGVSWPWRIGGKYIDKITEILADGKAMNGQLLVLSGGYVHGLTGISSDNDSHRAVNKDSVIKTVELLPYQDMEKLFSTQCDIGIELSDYNIEREFSSSFRSIEFLRCGMPVICNDTLELAEHVMAYDAGWVIQKPEDLPELLQAVSASPAAYNRKSENAIRLVAERYHYLNTIKPLIKYLNHLSKPGKINDWIFKGSETIIDNLNVTIQNQEEHIDDLHRQLFGKDKHIDHLNQKIDQIVNSYSWRLTRPLRVVSRMLQTMLTKFKKMVVLLRAIWNDPQPLIEFSMHESVKPSGARDDLFNKGDGRKNDCVAIITRQDIFPPTHGAAVKIERTAWGLSHFTDKVFLVTGDFARYYVFEHGSVREYYYPRLIRLTGLSAIPARKKLLRIGVPANEAFLYDAVFDWSYFIRLVYLAYWHKIFVYQAEFPAYAKPCLWASKLFSGKTLLVEHNVECDRIKTQYPETSEHAYGWLKRQEVEMCKRVDRVIAVSERDRDALVAHGVPPAKVSVIPHGVDLDLYNREYDFSLRDAYGVAANTPIIVYHGIYSYRPNLESVLLLAKEILPRLKARGWRAKVFAIGPEPPINGPDPDVVFTGAVDNLAPYLKSADLAVVPLQQGGGTRMKILEYFAALVPVVTTSKGIEGIPVKNGVQALIEDTFDGMAHAVVALLENPEQARAMASRAREFVDGLDWRRIAEQYLALIK